MGATRIDKHHSFEVIERGKTGYLKAFVMAPKTFILQSKKLHSSIQY